MTLKIFCFVSFDKILAISIVCSVIIINSCTLKSSEITSKDLYPDGVFKYGNKKFVLDDSLNKDYDKDAVEFKLPKLNSKDRELLTDPIFGSDFPYGAYFYSKQNKIEGLTPILVLVNADDYQSIILFVLSSESKVTDHLELTDDACDVVEQTDQKEIIGCHKRDSQFLNDSTIRITDLKILIDGYGKDDAITTTDSLSIDYRVSLSGLINQIQKDSVRYIKRGRINNQPKP
jgi:hypothetical protein